MRDHILDPNQRKRHNAFGEFVDKPLGYPSSGADADPAAGDHGQKKHKLNSEAPLSAMDQQLFPAMPLPNQLLSAFMENPTGSVKFQLFVSRSCCPTTSPPPVYILKVSSASNGEVDTAVKGVEGAAKPVLKETRLAAEGKFMLRSRL